MSNYILENLKRQIEQVSAEPRYEKVGHVVSVGDGIARVVGLGQARVQELLEFEENVMGIALNLEEDCIGVILLGSSKKVKEGDEVRLTGRVLEIPVSKRLIGRVVNPLAEPLDGLGKIFSEGGRPTFYPIENDAPSIIDRQPVNTPLYTGIRMIDAIIPIGRGQRELIIGDRSTGKTQIALDAIIAQSLEPLKNRPICIYVSAGQKDSKVAKLHHDLKQRGAMEYSLIVHAGSSDPASLIYLAPYAGCAIAEYFRDKGEDVLIIYDDLSKHAWAYRQISLLLRRPPGREAYPGDIFYLHSRLLERSAKLSDKKGGGSITALPIIETQQGDISAYIPTNVISITDGQIFLEPDLFYQGVRPAVNVGLSVSRVGSKAQRKAMKKAAGQLKLDLAQFRELEAFAQFGTELDEATRKRIERGQRIVEILKQDQFSPTSFAYAVAIIYAATIGALDSVELDRIKEFEAGFFEYLEREQKTWIKGVEKDGELTEKLENQLKKMIEEFKKRF